MMAMHLIDVARGHRQARLVCGLVWHPIAPSQLSRELKPMAAEANADLFVCRKSAKTLIGFARADQGAAPGQIPLGLVVCDHLASQPSPVGNALVVLRSPQNPELWCYLIIRDGFILADGDRVGSQDEIRQAFESDRQAGGWDLLVCPGHWGVDGAIERQLHEFFSHLPDAKRWPSAWALRPVNPALGRRLAKGLLLSLAIAAPVYGFFGWKKAQAEREMAQLQAQQMAAQDAERQRQMQTKPWPALPSAAQFAGACEKALQATSVIAANWSLSQFSCEGQSLTLSWVKAAPEALISQFVARYPKAVISPDGGSATVTYPLDIGPIADDAQPLQTVEFHVHRLLDLQASLGLTVTIAPRPVPASGPGTGASAMPWTDLKFGIQTEMAPSLVAQAADAAGLRLSTITGAFKDGAFTYQLTGVQYANN